MLLGGRLAGVLAGLAGITVSSQVITSHEEAARRGMRGCPAILLDGTDLLAGMIGGGAFIAGYHG